MQDFVAILVESRFVIAHNSKFELGWFSRMGVDLTEVLPFCTMIAEKVLAGNRPWGLHLDDCLKRRGMPGKDPIGRLIRLGVNTLDIPRRWLATYCMKDVEKTEQLFLDQLEQLHADGLLPVTYTRNITTPMLFDIESKGLCLDRERVEKVYAHYANEEAAVTMTWNELTDGVNVKSSPQKVELLYDTLGFAPAKDNRGRPMLTNSGEPKTDAAAIQALKPKNAKQKLVLETLQRLTAVRDALSKYVGSLNACAQDGGILHGEFSQTTAGTHRLSSKGGKWGIQLQNFQRLFRPCVRSRNPGWSIGDGDSANIEFRAAVDLAKDAQGLEDIEAGVDIHANTARVLFAGEWDDCLGPKEGRNNDLRQDSKANTFKPLYGGNSGTEAELAYFAAFRERYAATYDMQRGWTETVLRTKQLRVASGLLFYWPDCKLSRDGKYIKFTTQIYDYPVQSIATAEMIPTSTVYLWHMMKAAGMESFLIDIVHDSAVGEIHPDEREQWTEYLKYCFNVHIVEYLKTVYNYDWVCPLASDVKMSEYWSDSPEWSEQWQS
jgi:DNA polymerase I-like protein with 3'-5' exonuclease and polymerase domains